MKSKKSNQTENINLELNFNGGLGFSPNFTKTSFETKLTKTDAKYQLGGKNKNKQGTRTVTFTVRETILKHFLTDCVSRKESVSYRLACIFATRYPRTFSKLLKNPQREFPFAELTDVKPKSLLLSSGYLKRSGLGSLKSTETGKVVTYAIALPGKYATTFYNGLTSLCNRMHLCMGSLIGLVLERAYRNFGKVTCITSTAIKFERKMNTLPNAYRSLKRATKKYGIVALPVHYQDKRQEELLKNKIIKNSRNAMPSQSLKKYQYQQLQQLLNIDA